MAVSAYYFDHGGVNDVGVVDLLFSFTVASGAVVTTSYRGQGLSTVTYNATGDYTVTLSRDVRQVLFASAEPAGVSGGDKAHCQVYLNDVTYGEQASPLTFKVYAFPNGAAATSAADLTDNRRIYVLVKAKLSAGA